MLRFFSLGDDIVTKFHPYLQQLDGSGLTLVSLLRKTSHHFYWGIQLSSEPQSTPQNVKKLKKKKKVCVGGNNQLNNIYQNPLTVEVRVAQMVESWEAGPRGGCVLLTLLQCHNACLLLNSPPDGVGILMFLNHSWTIHKHNGNLIN